jgi:hypothetical protein
LPERRFHLDCYFLIASVEVRFPRRQSASSPNPALQRCPADAGGLFCPTLRAGRGPRVLVIAPMRNVSGGASNTMPPDQRIAEVARLQIPFAELFDIAIPFLLEQMRSHTNSQYGTARCHVVRCSGCVSPLRLRHQCASFRFPTDGRVRSQPNIRRLASRHFRDINDDSLRATPHLFHACL